MPGPKLIERSFLLEKMHDPGHLYPAAAVGATSGPRDRGQNREENHDFWAIKCFFETGRIITCKRGRVKRIQFLTKL